MRDLIEAVASSIQAEVPGASDWTLQRHDPMWRSPKGGKMLNVYSLRARPGRPRWTGGTIDLVPLVVEYGEPSNQKINKLKRNEEAELAAEDIADAIRDWALRHPAGFPPAHKLDWTATDYMPNVRRELFVRYCRVTFTLEVVKTFV